MPVRSVSDATFGREVLRPSIPVLVVFSAEWCRPGKAMDPALDALAADFEGKVKVAKIDVARNGTVKCDYEIHGMPTLILFKNGRPVARRVGGVARKDSLAEWINAALILALANQTVSVLPRAAEFKLANGMDVVVVPDHRAPIVTHMVWYRVGSADDPEGLSGIARLLEHLTFKSLDKGAAGEFSKTIARLGGQNNAFGNRDATVYIERIPRDQLRTVMELEVDRMKHLRLTDDEVATERHVITEMRRSTVDSNPTTELYERMTAALYGSHPYATPIGGKTEEIAKLSRKDAVRFYKRHYAPNNAVLVVSGDATPEEVAQLAEETYGRLRENHEIGKRKRLPLPVHEVARRLTLQDPRATNAMFERFYAVPSYTAAKPGDAEALDLLAKILGAATNGRLYRKLIVEERLATSTGSSISGGVVVESTFAIGAVAREMDLRAVEASVDAVLDDIRTNGVTQLEFGRAKKSLLAKYIFDSDNQVSLAKRYGWAAIMGRSADEVDGWPAAISKVTVDDIKRVANEHLDPRSSVTGWLLPTEVHASANAGTAADRVPFIAANR
jgi:zinc protease